MVKDPFFEREAGKYESPIASRELIISLLKELAKPANLEHIADALQLYKEEQKIALHRRLRAMERDGQIVFTRRKCYALPEKLDMIKGRVIAHRDGFGFLKVEGSKEDSFLPPDQMRRVLHGDIVLAQPLTARYNGKQEVRIVRIIEPRSDLIVGRYFLEEDTGFVVPDDSRLNFDILLVKKPDTTLRSGTVVVVELLKRPAKQQKATGVIVEILGHKMGTDLAIEIALRNHDIPHMQSDAVLQEAEHIAEEVSDSAKVGRVDLSDLPLVTIDGEDARDFDDAVYCEKKAIGWRLIVAIADVSHYVKPKTLLDKNAALRATSVYFPSRVVPMLPEVLSNGICSLNPQVDRLCLVCDMSLSDSGKMTSYRFYEAVINSHARLTYNEVFNLLKGDASLRERYASLVSRLEALYQLYKIMDRNRRERGAIDFEAPEPRFIFTADKRIESIEMVERNSAQKIIEECMIAANVAAAKFIEKFKVPSLYRVHEIPDEDRIANLRVILSELGLPWVGAQNPEPKTLAKLLDKIVHRPDRQMIQTLVLRSMKQAIYDPHNRGHFGLALEAYAHFTSPIRRYPDLLIHRTIKWILANQSKKKNSASYCYTMEEMLYFGQHCSMVERRTDEAVRDVIDWLKCDFMLDHIGEQYDGIISSVTNFGFFVRLNDLYIDGMVHVSLLKNDYYSYDPGRHWLIGQASGHVYQLGNRVRVKIESVSVEDHRIDFSLIEVEKKPKRIGKTAKDKINSPSATQKIKTKRNDNYKKKHKKGR